MYRNTKRIVYLNYQKYISSLCVLQVIGLPCLLVKLTTNVPTLITEDLSYVLTTMNIFCVL